MNSSVDRTQGGIRSEKGIFLLLVAIMVVGLGTFVVLVGIDAVIVRYVGSALRQRVDVLCHRVASNPLIQRTAATAFRNEINLMVDQGFPQYSQIVAARLYIPTMPANGNYATSEPARPGPGPGPGPNPNDDGGTIGGHGTGEWPAGGDYQYENETIDQPKVGIKAFSSLLPSGCRISFPSYTSTSDLNARPTVGAIETGTKDTGTYSDGNRTTGFTADCQYVGSPGIAQTTSSFTDKIFKRSRDEGNAVGCEVEGEIIGTLLPFLKGRRVVARAVWARPGRGDIDPSDKLSTRGLTILVGLAGNTNGSDPLDRFDSRWELDANGAPRTWLDPLVAGGNQPMTAFQGFSSFVYRGYETVTAAIPSETTRWGLIPTQNVLQADALGPPMRSYLDRSAIILSDASEAAVGCSNPHNSYRNPIIATVVALGAHNGQLRNRLEFLIAGLQVPGRNPQFYSSPYRSIPFGRDVLKRAYHLPMVAWDTGPGHDGTVGKNGIIDPYIAVGTRGSLSAEAEAWKTHYARLSAQLTDCFHLWREAQGGLKVPNLNDIAPIFNNQLFDPDSYTVDPAPTYKGSYNAGDPTSIECVNGDSSCVRTKTQLVDGITLAKLLGTIQNCPYEEVSPVFAPSTDPNYPPGLHVCHKPVNHCANDGAGWVQDDFKGSLLYIARASATEFGGVPENDISEGGHTAVPAIRAYNVPGVFPVTNPAGPLYYLTDDAIENRNIYNLATMITSPVIIFAQSRLPAGDIPIIREIVTKYFEKKRDITVVYIPKYPQDSTNQVIEEYHTAFIPSPDSRNTVLVYSPYSRSYYDESLLNNGGGTPTSGSSGGATTTSSGSGLTSGGGTTSGGETSSGVGTTSGSGLTSGGGTTSGGETSSGVGTTSGSGLTSGGGTPSGGETSSGGGTTSGSGLSSGAEGSSGTLPRLGRRISPADERSARASFGQGAANPTTPRERGLSTAPRRSQDSIYGLPLLEPECTTEMVMLMPEGCVKNSLSIGPAGPTSPTTSTSTSSTSTSSTSTSSGTSSSSTSSGSTSTSSSSGTNLIPPGQPGAPSDSNTFREFYSRTWRSALSVFGGKKANDPGERYNSNNPVIQGALIVLLRVLRTIVRL